MKRRRNSRLRSIEHAKPRLYGRVTRNGYYIPAKGYDAPLTPFWFRNLIVVAMQLFGIGVFIGFPVVILVMATYWCMVGPIQ